MVGQTNRGAPCVQYWDTCEYQDGVLNYNQDTHRQRTVNWCDTTGGTAAAFDFTTKGALAVRTHRSLASCGRCRITWARLHA